ncbi:hypothetical protein H4R19_001231 [Coemansia spiralis]|nr:hypothetical protein H4R19_001231 [Coemansia spiralis]
MECEYGYSTEVNNETTLTWGDFSEIPSKAGSNCPSSHNIPTDSMHDATLLPVAAETYAQPDIFELEHRKHNC